LRNYEDLEVWQSAHALAVRVYRITDNFPSLGDGWPDQSNSQG